MSMYCPLCFDPNVTPYRLVGSTQWYICGHGHKFSNPIILDMLSPEQVKAAVDVVAEEKQME